MFTKLCCPDRDQLQDLIDGQLPDAEQQELTRHLDTCAGCQQVLERLAEGEGPWPGRARPTPGPRPQLETALRHAMDELKDQTTVPPTLPAEADEVLLLGSPDWTAERERFAPYEVTEVLGRGGMSVVLKAFDPSLNRNVAIKVLAPQLAACAPARRRFAREAKAAAAVSHEHVVAIHAVEPKGSLPYLVMQYVPGVSLQERLDRTGPLELPEILRIGMQVACGLAAAHAQGLVHRDVKPANILLENGLDRVKLTDFGLARAADDASLTQSGVLAGTPQYMAPEQSRGEALDHRADLFSLGSVLYAMCTGRPPFRASTTLAVLRRVSDDTPRSIRALNRNIPEWLVRIVTKLHAKAPAQRYPSATEVAQLLEQCLAHVQSPETAPLPATLQPPPSRWRRWGLIAAGLFAVIAMLGIVIRIQTAEGTLVVEVDDADVKVTVQGDHVLITGVGPQEIRLRPGQYSVEGAKEGVRPFKDYVTISRDGKKVVTVRMEPPSAGTDAAKQPLPGGLQGHVARVTSVAFTPDGKLIASADGSNNVSVVDSATGRLVLRLASPQKRIVSLAVFPDGQTLATLHGDGTVTLWDVATGKQKAQLQLGDQMQQGALSPDGKRLATVGELEKVRVWDAATGREMLRLDQGRKVLSVSFAPDGKLLATGTPEHQVILWDVSTGKEVRALPQAAGPIHAIAFSPDGRRIAAGDDTVRLWDVQTGRDMGSLPGHEGRVQAVAYSPDGLHVASAGFDGTVRIWDTAFPKEVRKLKAHHGAVTCLAFGPDGRRLVTGGDDGKVKIWDVASGRQIAELAMAGAAAEQATQNDRLRIVELEQRAAAAEAREATARLQAEQAEAEAQRNLYAAQIHLAQQEWEAKDKARAEKALDRIPPEARGWEWRYLRDPSKDRTAVLEGHTGIVVRLAFHPGGQILASAGRDRTIRLWDPKTGKVVAGPFEQDEVVRTIAFSPDGQYLAVGRADGTIRLLDPASGEAPVTLKSAEGDVRALGFSPDGRRIAWCSGDGAVRIYEFPPAQQVRTLEGHKQPGMSVAFSPDGKLLASADMGGTIILWDAASGKQIRAMMHEGPLAAPLAFSPDGKRIVSAGQDGNLRLWDLASGRLTHQIKGHNEPVTALAFTPDGQRLVTGGVDQTVRLWEASTGAELLTLKGHTGPIYCLAISPDGTVLATGSADRSIHLWIAPPATKEAPRQ